MQFSFTDISNRHRTAFTHPRFLQLGGCSSAVPGLQGWRETYIGCRHPSPSQVDVKITSYMVVTLLRSGLTTLKNCRTPPWSKRITPSCLSSPTTLIGMPCSTSPLREFTCGISEPGNQENCDFGIFILNWPFQGPCSEVCGDHPRLLHDP